MIIIVTSQMNHIMEKDVQKVKAVEIDVLQTNLIRLNSKMCNDVSFPDLSCTD